LSSISPRPGYIDSSGLGVLVSLSKKIREQGGELRLAGLNADLQTLFELTKLDTLFSITRTARRRWRRSDVSLQLHVTRDAMRLDVPSDLGMVGDAVELVASHLPPGTLSPRRINFNLRTPSPKRSATRFAMARARIRSGRQCQRRAGARRRADPRRG